jgi:hypothetical protein
MLEWRSVGVCLHALALEVTDSQSRREHAGGVVIEVSPL